MLTVGKELLVRQDNLAQNPSDTERQDQTLSAGLGVGPAQTIETAANASRRSCSVSRMSERPDRKQIKRMRPLHRQSQAKQNRNFPQTRVRLTTRRFDDIARDRKIGCLNFPYVWVARIGRRARPGDRLRAVIATAAIAGHDRAAVNSAARQYRNREISNDTHCHSDARRNER